MFDDMTYISKVDFHEACVRWQMACQHKDTQKLFEKYIGITMQRASEGDNQYLLVLKKDRERLELLLGPYHHAIIKAWVVNNG
jgi:hypothetical protein